MPTDSKKWLLLIHQLPPKPNALRVKIWRRLNQVGAVAIKQSVYAMPLTEQAREDFSWIFKEIVAGGGDGSISEARFLEGLSDGEVIALFQAGRKADYEKVIQEANQLLAARPGEQYLSRDQAVSDRTQVSKLRHRLDEISAIDFFHAPERGTAEMLIKDLEAKVWAEKAAPIPFKENSGNLQGRTWVTRQNPFVDRIACGWLIRRFVDDKAVFKFVRESQYTPKPGELRFDMFAGEFTHEGDQCTFEVMIRRLEFKDRALATMAEVIHDLDLKDGKYGRVETAGFSAMLTGLVASIANDDQRLEEGGRMIEHLYAYFKRRKGE